MRLLLIFIPILIFASPFHDSKQSQEISSSVVKIFTVSAKPNYYQPWQIRTQKLSTGSGVILDKRRILTAAHVVDNAVYIEVKKNKSPEKFIANVEWISHEADLALLILEDESFFDKTTPLSIGKMPKRQEGVAVYGYPHGGNEISITQGIISRIEQTRYVHSNFDLLSIQIDAAINPGNSGGPAFNQDGEIIGIAMQALSSADNIGYLVPTTIIEHFLQDIQDGRYDGFADDGLYIQGMENKTLKQFYDMQERTGVLITKVIRGSSCDGYLKQGDILLSIDRIDVADDASVRLGENGRVAASYLIRSHHINETFEAKILREGKELHLDIPLKRPVSFIPYEHDEKPQYYILGGVVMMPLTQNYLYEWGRNWLHKAPIHFVNRIKNYNFPEGDKKELLFIQSILTDKENAGYKFSNAIINKINGTTVTSFKQMVKIIEGIQDDKIKIELVNGTQIILDKQKATEANKRILRRYNIQSNAYIRD